MFLSLSGASSIHNVRELRVFEGSERSNRNIFGKFGLNLITFRTSFFCILKTKRSLPILFDVCFKYNEFHVLKQKL